MLPMDAAAHTIGNGSDDVKAVELLDKGRSLLWSELRRLRKPLFQTALVDDAVIAAFEQVRRELRAMSTQEARYEHVLAEGRASGPSTWPSYGRLLPKKRNLPKEYEDLRKQITRIL